MLCYKMVFVNVSGSKCLVASRALKHSIRHYCGFRDNLFRDNIALRQKNTSHQAHINTKDTF
jgi:hypothetical protein